MDFEAMIRDAQKNGLTIDDIAKMFSKTLNAVQQEDQKKKAITDARTELIEHMKDQFETAVSKGHLDCTDAAALYTLTMAEKYSDWTAENIKDYFQIIKLNAETTATMVGKEPDELLQALLDKVDTVPKTNKSKDKSDNEKIADFLREIGL
jgi:DNA-binding transcriptional MerR regulator